MRGDGGRIASAAGDCKWRRKPHGFFGELPTGGISDRIRRPMENETSSTDYRAIRIENMRALQAAGHEPFGRRFDRTGTISEIRVLGEPLIAAAAAAKAAAEAVAAQSAAAQPIADSHAAPAPVSVKAAGRLLAIRKMGKTVFADMRDGSGRIQLFVNAKNCGDAAFAAFAKLDLGDHVGCAGELFVTRTGELSVRVESWTLLSKALIQPPEKFHGLVDTEDRYRRRHVDLFSNPESRERFYKRSAILRETRRWLEGRGFMEVETPILQSHAGGATAKPFVTHYNALDRDVFLRIAPELYLKRLIVGGFDKVFEIGRDFRNEGLDRTHNPEFTVLELYQAYGDRRSMMDIIEGLLPHLCDTVIGSRKVQYGGAELDFTPPYREVSYEALVKERMGDDWFELPLAEAQKRVEAQGLPFDPAWNELLLTHEVYDKLVERTLVQPTFVTRIPHEFVPLAKTCPDDPTKADVFEFVVGGRELCPGYTEQNDPFAQREAFSAQVEEDAESEDLDFVEALECGMPPTGGLGLGMDRLTMMLTGTEVIRDVILFPMLKDSK